MNYKELFERYKEGLLDDEEKKLVEKEIERYEAIEAYLAEELDETLDNEMMRIDDYKIRRKR